MTSDDRIPIQRPLDELPRSIDLLVTSVSSQPSDFKDAAGFEFVREVENLGEARLCAVRFAGHYYLFRFHPDYPEHGTHIYVPNSLEDPNARVRSLLKAIGIPEGAIYWEIRR